MLITLVIPCFVDLISPQVGIRIVSLLEGLGHQIDCPDDLGCCGQPNFNAGCWDEAREAARPVLRRLRNSESIVIASGSCGAMLKVFYKEIFQDQPEESEANTLSQKCWELTDFLVNKLGVTDLGASFPHKVTYHDGCHGLRELNLKRPARQLLEKVRGLQLVEMKEAETCCGFGGSFSTKFPMVSTAMGEVKCASAEDTAAEYLVSADSNCLMHLQGLLSEQKAPLKTIHIAEVLTARS
ncbi:MAG: (Fe-S)-binding protein [Prosthecobacter sp.]